MKATIKPNESNKIKAHRKESAFAREYAVIDPATGASIVIQIPFAGFYYSVHSDAVERELEHIAESDSFEVPESLVNLFHDAAQYGDAYRAYGKEYAESFIAEYLDDSCAFVAMESPRYYNYDTDRIFVSVTRDTVARLVHGTDKAILGRACKARFTSRDGFISHYSSDWQEWGNVSEWDHNQLGTLLIAYLETERGQEWDCRAEVDLMESYLCNGGPSEELWQGEKAARAWRIYDCLENRAARPVKTMSQWRVAFAKPFSTTPLGGLACLQQQH